MNMMIHILKDAKFHDDVICEEGTFISNQQLLL